VAPAVVVAAAKLKSVVPALEVPVVKAEMER
jgi:hypothetical protein